MENHRNAKLATKIQQNKNANLKLEIMADEKISNRRDLFDEERVNFHKLPLLPAPTKVATTILWNNERVAINDAR